MGGRVCNFENVLSITLKFICVRLATRPPTSLSNNDITSTLQIPLYFDSNNFTNCDFRFRLFD